MSKNSTDFDIKITKFVHSCVLVETSARVVLVDPGVYSWNSSLFQKHNVTSLDRIAITHSHPDHYDKDFLRYLLKRWPSAHLVANQDVLDDLATSNIGSMYRIATQCSVPFKSVHAPGMQWAPTIPDQTGFHIMNIFTHPGDSHTFKETMPILALPLNASWGSLVDALDCALRLKPQVVVPIHDWHLRDEARLDAYDKAAKVLNAAGIDFIPLKNGETQAL